MLKHHLLLQKMVRYDDMDTYIHQSDMIFHWHTLEQPPAPKSTSPADPRFRRYTTKVVRFASEIIKAKAVAQLDISKLADVAVKCSDGRPESTGYWLELLAVRWLQVRPALSCVLVAPSCCVSIMCLQRT